MLKLYFTAATSFNGELHDLYVNIYKILKSYIDVAIISGHQIMDKKILEQDKNLTSEQIFSREKKFIEQADFVVAEASKPSLGVGSEITFALTSNKPVLALVNTTFEDRISPMIAGNPSENLFLEFYNKDNIEIKIKDFLKYIRNLSKRKGKLIVIDGGDGSGKTTQAELLVNYLKKKNIPVKYYDFPQYYHSFHGNTVAKFLRGEFGKIGEVSPYLASLAYALDRISVKKEMDELLSKGHYLIANRYATSNMAHQAAKFKTETEKREYLKWIYELEYKVHKIPKEDVVIYLYVPWEIGYKLTKGKGQRTYLNGKKDIAEEDLKHRIETEKMYLFLAKKYKHWKKIDCVKNGKLLSKEAIHHKILALI